MKSRLVIGDYYVGYIGEIRGTDSTHNMQPAMAYGKILALFETTNFGWCCYKNVLGIHLLCLG